MQHLGGTSLCPQGLLPTPGPDCHLSRLLRRLPSPSRSCWLLSLLWVAWRVAGGLSLVLGNAGHEVGLVVTGSLGQGQCTPGLLAQGPPQAGLGAQGHGGEGEVLRLEFELQVAGGQGVVHLAGGLQGGQGYEFRNPGCQVGLRGQKASWMERGTSRELST